MSRHNIKYYYKFPLVETLNNQSLRLKISHIYIWCRNLWWNSNLRVNIYSPYITLFQPFCNSMLDTIFLVTIYQHCIAQKKPLESYCLKKGSVTKLCALEDSSGYFLAKIYAYLHQVHICCGSTNKHTFLPLHVVHLEECTVVQTFWREMDWSPGWLSECP